MSNTADPKFREVKDREGGPEIGIAKLFRLDSRTVISEYTEVASNTNTPP